VEVPGGRQWRVFRINPALPPSRLTATAAIGPSADGDAFLPHPSPDGHQIAFLFGAVESAQVWLMNSDGTRLSRLTGFDSEAFPYSCRALHWAAP
jgi:Tol biopolymer transport system component